MSQQAEESPEIVSMLRAEKDLETTAKVMAIKIKNHQSAFTDKDYFGMPAIYIDLKVPHRNRLLQIMLELDDFCEVVANETDAVTPEELTGVELDCKFNNTNSITFPNTEGEFTIRATNIADETDHYEFFDFIITEEQRTAFKEIIESKRLTGQTAFLTNVHATETELSFDVHTTNGQTLTNITQSIPSTHSMTDISIRLVELVGSGTVASLDGVEVELLPGSQISRRGGITVKRHEHAETIYIPVPREESTDTTETDTKPEETQNTSIISRVTGYLR